MAQRFSAAVEVPENLAALASEVINLAATVSVKAALRIQLTHDRLLPQGMKIACQRWRFGRVATFSAGTASVFHHALAIAGWGMSAAPNSR